MPNQQPSLDLMFQALADPARRSMVERLSRGPASVSELARPLDMSLPAVMQHLAMLEALAGREHLGITYAEALREGYLWHEFGDLHLILP